MRTLEARYRAKPNSLTISVAGLPALIPEHARDDPAVSQAVDMDASTIANA
jgi:hypothetical protein